MILWALKMNTLVFLNSKKCDSLITYLIVCQKKIFNGVPRGIISRSSVKLCDPLCCVFNAIMNENPLNYSFMLLNGGQAGESAGEKN